MSNQTPLDAWQPSGEPIHPFDLYELMMQSKSDYIDVKRIENSPAPQDEADYVRNWHKGGDVVEVLGKTYFETTTIQPVTKAFA